MKHKPGSVILATQDIFVRLRPDIISTSGIAWETLRSPQNGTFVVPAQGAYGHQTNLHGERSPHAGVTDNFALLSARAIEVPKAREGFENECEPHGTVSRVLHTQLFRVNCVPEPVSA